MWKVVYIAKDEIIADKIKDKLVGEGFMVQLRELSKNKKGQVEILVPSSEAPDVVEFLTHII
ncbi:hypothetical protein SAMN02745227_00784 [Anaerobranca californiensis DSM 14826]|uniref:Signal transducing protein n=1 Tax=Anaerobranca californiensis DSM 14826 TaxID=1120989 RepID=A0A1M6MI69_9FIRM|nr:hypothetical protein [Anaerobranca californiensis]SHJ83138.1 hypothetical protein SAMN02745227_00784 [Anaerobranca californiensis DSM 14826]